MTISTQTTEEFTHIGHYDILDCIGRGGMGLVYLARDTRLNRQVAIKCLRTELFAPHYRERFKREALLLAKLNHPHIVQIYDFIETPEQLALVMEFVDGKNLQLYLREHIVPFAQRMQWLTQIAQGLAIAHEAGIIHRDLKSENILINKRGAAKISDLGIAKSQDFNATLTDHVAGSYCSMSPEQAMGEDLDFRSDLFSFGIMAYQMLCGAHPFGETDNKLQLMQRIISHPPIPPSNHNPNLPKEISDLLGQLLSKNINNRPANTHWLAAQCEKLSQLALSTSFESDNTPALPHAQHKSSANNLGARTNQGNTTQEHATFESRPKQLAPKTKKMYTYLKKNSVTAMLGGLTLLILLGAGIWQLQPKQPRYVAVLPPTLNTADMQESQQELVKGAVYDAIQQSIIQLDGYYLIPQNEIADINASSNKEGLETVRRATAADELITTDIQCKVESCTITLSRLTPDGKKTEGRLRVLKAKTVDVLTDNYLSVATIVQSNVGGLYSETFNNSLSKINEQDYAAFLETNNTYREKGASHNLLDDLEKLQYPAKSLPAIQTLYTEVALDLHNTTKNPTYLQNIEKYIATNSTKNGEAAYLYNLYYLQIAQGNFEGAEYSITKLKRLNASNSSINELYGYKMMVTKDYQSAIKFYTKAISSKKTANNLLYVAKAYWYSGETKLAKKYITDALAISPEQHKALSLFGLIVLTEGNFEQACAYFKVAITQNPNEMDSLGNLGVCNLLQKNFALAIQYFDQASTLNPENTSLLLNKADAESLSGSILASQEIYQKIIDSINRNTINSENLRNLSQAYAHLGKFSAALTTLQELERIDAQNIETTYTAALVHTLANNHESAILNIDNTLKNGMNRMWFSFSWFDLLCSDVKFSELLKNYGEPNRCTLQ